MGVLQNTFLPRRRAVPAREYAGFPPLGNDNPTDRQECLSYRTKYPHGFLSAKLAAIRQVAARLQPHFRKIGDNALLLTGLGNVFAVRRYKKVRTNQAE